MSTAEHLEQTRKELDERYRFLTVRIQAVQKDLDRELDGERQVVLSARLTDLSQERDRLVVQLETLEAEGPAILSGTYELPDEPAPYRGLLPFQAEHARFFFGRDADRRQLVDRLRRHTFVAVVGASGSGKSSLVRAGLLPSLAANALADSSTWRVLTFTPGGQPLRTLASQLATLAPDGDRLEMADRLTERLAQRTDGLHTILSAFLADRPQTVLLVIDQLEELFTLCREDAPRCRSQVEQFVANLADAVQQGAGQVRAVATLRADFLDRCLAFPQLRDLLQDRQLLLGPMDEDALREAIMRPAQEVGALFEPGLVNIILRDVADEPGALPLMQHALYELWLARRGPWLTVEAYETSGGVLGALEKRAQDTYEELSPEKQAIARNIFLRLTALGEGVSDTRRRVDRHELYPAGVDTAVVDTVLQALSAPQARLIVADEESAEVAHEALIQQWRTLRTWLEDDREALRVHRHLTEAARDWEELNHDPGELYRGTRLAQAEEWVLDHGPDMTPEEQAFLEASQVLRDEQAAERERQQRERLEAAEERTRLLQERAQAAEALAEEQQQRAEAEAENTSRLRRRSAILAVAMVLATVAFGFAIFFNYQSTQATREAQNVANALATEVVQRKTALARSERAQATAEQARFEAEQALRGVKTVAAAEADQMQSLVLQLQETLVATSGSLVMTDEGMVLRQPLEMEFVRVPADPDGEFLMGSDTSRDSDAENDELPQHPVSLSEFYIGKHEVTNAQYAVFVEATGHRIPSHWENGSIPAGLEEHPVVNVSWNDAVAFTEWLSDETDISFRLPTEAEWEKACRGTDGRIYPWGDEFACAKGNFDDETEITSYVVPGGEGCDGYVRAAPVGSFEDGASPYGALDMAGNVWEWTSSGYGDYPYDPTDGREDQDAPDSVARVLRGGSFYYNARFVRCADRFRNYPTYANVNNGFRVGLLPPSSGR